MSYDRLFNDWLICVFKSVQEIIEQQSPLETAETCDAEISLDMYESAARSSSVVESPCTTVLTRVSKQ